MSINTNRSFSHAVSEHRNKASGFTEEELIFLKKIISPKLYEKLIFFYIN